MKPLIYILLILIGSSANAQKIRFTDHNNSWKTYCTGMTTCPFDRILSYETDTLISGKTYQHLLEQDVMFSWSGCLPQNRSRNYYVREDTTAGIIYYRELVISPYSDTNEHIYFNYNLHAGDTILFSGNATRDSVLEVDSTLINSVYHKLFIMGTNGTMSTYTFVEGVGCMKYPYVPFTDNCGDYYEALMCFSQSGVNPDMNFPVHNCYIAPPDTFHNISSCNALYTPNTLHPATPVTIQPNPAYDHIDITTDNVFDNNTTVSVYNMSGIFILNATAVEQKNTLPINTTSWIDGLYMIIVQNNSGIIKKEKILVIK